MYVFLIAFMNPYYYTVNSSSVVAQNENVFVHAPNYSLDNVSTAASSNVSSLKDSNVVSLSDSDKCNVQ